MRTFDPKWLVSGEFAVGGDGVPSRTQRVRNELNRLENASFSMHRLREQGRPATVYYLRESQRTDVEAQYYMVADRDLRTLGLGLSIEKGEEHRDASEGRRMARRQWDWRRLPALGEKKLAAHVEAISAALERPVSVVIDYHHLDHEGDEVDRLTVPFTLLAGAWWKRGARSSPKELADRLREVDGKKDWWADVWILADYTGDDAAMSPEEVAGVLYAFHGLRDALRARGKRGRSAATAKRAAR